MPTHLRTVIQHREGIFFRFFVFLIFYMFSSNSRAEGREFEPADKNWLARINIFAPKHFANNNVRRRIYLFINMFLKT